MLKSASSPTFLLLTALTMTSITLPKHKFLCFTLTLLFFLCCFSAGYAAEDNPGQMLVTALACFNNKFIYAGCDEAYRLNESGNINVPPEAVDLFCHGPCMTETQQVLNCVDNMLSDFVFNNKATLPDIRGALRAGCSYTSQRGIFKCIANDYQNLMTGPERQALCARFILWDAKWARNEPSRVNKWLSLSDILLNGVGKFDGLGPFGEYLQGETSTAQKLPNFLSLFTLFIVTSCSLFILH